MGSDEKAGSEDALPLVGFRDLRVFGDEFSLDFLPTSDEKSQGIFQGRCGKRGTDWLFNAVIRLTMAAIPATVVLT